MILKAYDTYFDTIKKEDMQELYNRVYDTLVDDYLNSGILITEEALQEQTEEIIQQMQDKYEEIWEEHA